jgi:hypothetical protein
LTLKAAMNFFKTFPELERSNKISMSPAPSFFKGIFSRIFNRKNRQKKIFIIGFHKTGTSSLGKAFQILGYRVCGGYFIKNEYRNVKNPEEYLWNYISPAINDYEVFQDTPWFIFWRQIYKNYPNALYILTYRDSEKWYNSVYNHFGDGSNWFYHDLIYGDPDPTNHKDLYIKKYEDHNKNVMDFFEGKNNFLPLDLDQGIQWESLVEFTGNKKPIWQFPMANKSETKDQFSRIIVQKIRNIWKK